MTGQMLEIYRLAAGALLSVLLLAILHWFPWVRRLPRLTCYKLGVAAIWLGFATWRGLAGDWITPLGLAMIVVAGGLAVIGAYRIDDVVQRLRQAQMAEAIDRDLAAE